MEKIKIVSWNVNSVNARLENLIKLIKLHSPDVLLLQEIKGEEIKFPRGILEDMGYNIALSGQKSYNGVAILSKYILDDIIVRDFEGAEGEARYIEGVISVNEKCLRVASIYVPNGQMVKSPKFYDKLAFIADIKTYWDEVKKYGEMFIVGGDFNVAQEDIDVCDPIKMRGTIGFHDTERSGISAILESGFIDTLRKIKPNEKIFSWWDYRDRKSFTDNKGMRVDYIVATKNTTISDAYILTETRAWERPSDHAPVVCEVVL